MEESLILSTIAFESPKKPITFYFSQTVREDMSLTNLSHQLFPVSIKEIFPNITKGYCIYTSFTRKFEGFTPLEIVFATDISHWPNCITTAKSR
jgi:hypothetical protein